MSRGVIYLVWGEKAEEAAQRSIESLKQLHPELPHELHRLPADTDPYSGLLEKSRMMRLSPFDETLFLDADTVVLDRLDFGFEQARRHALACCICENPWSRRYRGLPNDDAIDYNTGVIFFTREAEPLFREWERLTPLVDSTTDFIDDDGNPKVMPYADQAAFARALREWSRAPFVLPLNWNFRPNWHTSWFGPLKIWHGYGEPPAGIFELVAYYRRPDAIVQFHSFKRK